MYENMALFYDSFTDDLDREKEARFLEDVFLRFGNRGLKAVGMRNAKADGFEGPLAHGPEGSAATASEKHAASEPHRSEALSERGPEEASADGTGAVNGEDIDLSTLVIDVGCGTGDLSILMSRKGYDVTGLDVSPEMLDVASRKAEKAGESILWLCQDMCEMDTYGSYAAMFCFTDGINHIQDKDSLCAFFERARNFIDRGGLLIFDFLPPRYLRRIARQGILYDSREEGSCVWWGEYNRGVIDYEIECFVGSKSAVPKGTVPEDPASQDSGANEDLCEGSPAAGVSDDHSSGGFVRYRESVSERGWTAREIKKLLRRSGFRILECKRCDTDGENTAEPAGGIRPERYYAVARRI